MAFFQRQLMSNNCIKKFPSTNFKAFQAGLSHTKTCKNLLMWANQNTVLLSHSQKRLNVLHEVKIKVIDTNIENFSTGCRKKRYQLSLNHALITFSFIHSSVISHNSNVFQLLNSILACGSQALLDVKYEVALVPLNCFSLSLRN